MVEAPGTAPGSETLMPRGVYRHSRFPDTPYIGGSTGFLKANTSSVPRRTSGRLYKFSAKPIKDLSMDIISYSQAQKDLGRLMDKVSDDRAPLIVTRRGGRSVVMLSLEDYRSMEETLYLMRSPANARRLLKSIRAADRGELTQQALIEPKPHPRRRLTTKA